MHGQSMRWIWLAIVNFLLGKIGTDKPEVLLRRPVPGLRPKSGKGVLHVASYVAAS
jgi:hypothetical protein